MSNSHGPWLHRPLFLDIGQPDLLDLLVLLTMTATAAAAKPRAVNPYAKPVHNAVVMGRQSQQRVSNQHKRKYKLCSSNNKKGKKGDQLTLEGAVAFNSESVCRVCKAKSIKKFLPSYNVPKRSHHIYCPLNTTTRGLGPLTEATINSIADNKRYKLLTAPILPEERFSSVNNTKAAVSTFFVPKPKPKNPPASTVTAPMTTTDEDPLTPLVLSNEVSKLVDSVEFREKHKTKGAPLAMLAFAKVVEERIIRHKNKELFYNHFNGIEMVVPACHDHDNLNPHYHSITGQKLLHVNWEKAFGIEVPVGWLT